MHYTIIDMEKDPRCGQFAYFRAMQYPFASVTVEVDITDMMTARGSRPFFLSLLYAVVRAANAVPQLRRRILPDGRVAEYDWCPPSYTAMKPDGVYVYCTVEGDMPYGTFIAEGQRRQLMEALALLALLFVVMPSVQSFYQILSQLTVLLYLIMYMLMFSAAIVLRYKMKGTARPFRLGKKGNGLMWTIGTVGFCGALLAFILSFVPPSQISVGSNTVWFSVLIIGCVVVVGAPFVIYAMRKPSWKDPQAAAEFAPFHWEVKAAPETQNIPQNNPQNTGNTAPENKQ